MPPTHSLDTPRTGSPSLELPPSLVDIPILVKPINHTADLYLYRSSQVRSFPTHLHDLYCYTTLATLHKPHSYCEVFNNPLWDDVITAKLDALSKNYN